MTAHDPELFIYDNMFAYLHPFILFMDGLTEFSDMFCQITLPTLVLLHCSKQGQKMCLSSWGILGINILKVIPTKFRPAFLFFYFLPFILILPSIESKMREQKILPPPFFPFFFFLEMTSTYANISHHFCSLLAVNKLLNCKTLQFSSSISIHFQHN